jgi:hypothetical protein
MNRLTLIVFLSSVALSMANATDSYLLPDSPSIPVRESKVLSVDVAASYMTHAGFRGLIPASSDGNDANLFEIGSGININDSNQVALEMRYKYLWDKTWVDRNETNVSLGWLHEVNDNVSWQVGWDLYDGGIPGTVAKESGHSAHGVTQEGMMGIEFKSSDSASSGVFAGANLHYSFQGLTGWWGDVVLGFVHKMNEFTSMEVSGRWNIASSYWNGGETHFATGGTQSWGVDIRFPIKISDSFRITPLVGSYWAGNGAHGRMDDGSKVFRRYTFIIGCQAGWNF